MVKASIFDLDGNEVVSQRVKLHTVYPGHDRVEREYSELRAGVYAVIRNALDHFEPGAKAINGIGVTGQANGLYLFDARGNPLSRAILSSDMRAKKLVEQWNEDGTYLRILPKTRQALWAGQTAVLMSWFARYGPEILNEAETCVTAMDYVRYLLTGEFCMEETQRSSMSIVDLNTGLLSEEVALELGIKSCLGKFPEKVVGSTEICGKVTREAAKYTGLQEGTPVSGGLIDTAACLISQGITEEEMLGMIVGTWGINAYISRENIVSKDIFSAFNYCIPGYRLILEGSATSAVNLEWYIEEFLRPIGGNVCSYEEINRMVEVSDFRENLIFLPFLYGSNVGVKAKAAFVGLKAEHTKANMLRSIFEGVAFCHLYHTERLLKFRNMPSTVRIAGGAAKSKVWMQMFADVLGVKIEVSKAGELGALGAAMTAGVGMNAYGSMEEAAKRIERIDTVYEPREAFHALYRKKYRLYKKLVQCLDEIWDEMDS